jgi:hypothetical protein
MLQVMQVARIPNPSQMKVVQIRSHAQLLPERVHFRGIWSVAKPTGYDDIRGKVIFAACFHCLQRAFIAPR